MDKRKRVLLIGGGGTLGTYTAKELLRLGALVDVICPEEKCTDNANLHFYRAYATERILAPLLALSTSSTTRMPANIRLSTGSWQATRII